MNFLDRAQSKSNSIKARYAFIGACFITGVIAVVWASTVPSRFNGIDITQNSLSQTEEKETPGIGEIWGDTKTQVGNIIDWNGETAAEPELSPDSALGSLGTESTTSEEIVVAASTTPLEGEEEEKSAQPRVIMIATTTSQKSE